MKTKLIYCIYQNVNGLLLEPKDYWESQYTMFSFLGYETIEEALEAIQKEDHAPDGLIILPTAIKVLDGD